jgi:hypothetical protein
MNAYPSPNCKHMLIGMQGQGEVGSLGSGPVCACSGANLEDNVQNFTYYKILV